MLNCLRFMKSPVSFLRLLAIVSVILPAGEAFASVSRVVLTNSPAVSASAVPRKTRQNSRYLPGAVIVKLRETSGSLSKSSFGVGALDQFVQRYGTQSVSRVFPDGRSPLEAGNVDLARFYVVRYSSPVDAFTAAEEISQQPGVEYAEPWFVYAVNDEKVFTPNDPSLNKQWSLRRIHADAAWDISQGDTSVVLAIVDTGVQTDHPDLAANIWHNPGETGTDAQGHDKRFNNIDDDNDGKVDDWQGWDFVGGDFTNPAGDNDPSPKGSNTSHGTHVSGIASAVTDNSIGIAGVGVRCRILPVKASGDNDFRGPEGTALIQAGYEGIVYAAQMGANVINCSWGGAGYSTFEQDMVNYTSGLGALIVAAAGNGGYSADPQVPARPEEPIYPASYDNVFSVAATDSADRRTYYTSYGVNVDASAPGGIPTGTGDFGLGIYSTLYPSTYEVEAGTSQASPHVTGLAGLVKARFPSFNGQQIAEQIRMNCDDISSQNPGFDGKLGAGRINAYRALADSMSPGIRMTALAVSDSAGGNNNGSPEPDETIDLVGTFVNYLRPTTAAAQLAISSADTNVQILSGSFTIGAVPTLGTASNYGTPFRFHINPHVPIATTALFKLSIIDVNAAQIIQYFTVFLYPSYATHNVNNVLTTLTNNGNIGFYDFPSNQRGVGFIYNGVNQLYEAGLMVGYSSTRLVDVVRNEAGEQDQDFVSPQVYKLRTPGTVSDQDGSSVFTDDLAPAANKLAVQIKTHSYAFAFRPNRDFVLLRYDIKNTSGSPISNLYAGIFSDWDVHSPLNSPADTDANYFDHNMSSFDASRSLGYMWYNQTGSTYCGVRALEGAAGYFPLKRDSIYPNRASKWTWLSSGQRTASGVSDYHFVVSSGPYSLPAGATKIVAFAMVGGTDLPGLQASADAALSKWEFVKSTFGPKPRFSIAIHQNPVASQFADIYVTSDVLLDEAPSMSIATGTGPSDAVVLSLHSPNIYKGSYRFQSAGVRTISVTGSGTNGEDTTVARQFTVGLLKRGIAGSIGDPTGTAGMSFPAGTLAEDTYVLATAEDAGVNPLHIDRTYTFSPERGLKSAAAVTIGYPPALSPEEARKLSLYRKEASGWTPLESWVDARRHVVVANISALGTFALGSDGQTLSSLLPADYVLYQNYPNPFNPQTTIRFAMPEAGRVRLKVYNLLGQQVKNLLDEDRGPGVHEVVWNSDDEHAVPVASGVYVSVLQVVNGGKVAFGSTEKMIIIR